MKGGPATRRQPGGTRYIFVNLKRFEVPRALGGVCPSDEPISWITSVIAEAVEGGIGELNGTHTVFLLPEGLLTTAVRVLGSFDESRSGMIAIGCQGVHWEDIEPEGNFGAFTTLLPAKAASNFGARWTIIGHSEERRAKMQLMTSYDPSIETSTEHKLGALRAVDQQISREVVNALQAELNVLLCVGETAEQRGEWAEAEIRARLEAAMKGQLMPALNVAGDLLHGGELVVAYEPVWAIGPGKTPPGKSYIEYAASVVKRATQDALGRELPVVYGGGLKQSNAAMLGGIEYIDGGLIALTRFTGEIGFNVQDLIAIIDAYRQGNLQAG